MKKGRQGRLLVKSKRGRGKSNALGEEITWQKGRNGKGGVGRIKIKQNFIHPLFNAKTKKYVKIRQATKEPIKKGPGLRNSPSVWSPPILLTPQLSN